MASRAKPSSSESRSFWQTDAEWFQQSRGAAGSVQETGPEVGDGEGVGLAVGDGVGVDVGHGIGVTVGRGLGAGVGEGAGVDVGHGIGV